MRQKSLFVRTVGVCFCVLLFSFIAFAQTDKITEGSLRAFDANGNQRGLCPLKNTDVKAEISGFLSRVTVTQTFQNPFDENIEAVYTFPLPNDAAVDDMTIQIGERFIKSRIMENQKAKETYEAARQEGKVAALLEQQRPNIFAQSVANITPNAEIKVIISYIETLKYTDGTYEFTFPMTIGERYIPLAKTEDALSSSNTGVPDAAKISPARTDLPLHRVSLEVKLDTGVSIESLASNTHEIESQRFSASQFIVKLKNENEIPNRDFVLKFKTAGEKIEDALLAHKDKNGGFFTMILQPPDKIFPADATPKEIVFVLDTSGSMNGFPIEKAKEAMMLSLNGLNPQDTFNLISFAGDTNILFEKPVSATPGNLKKAKEFLDSRKSDGGTEMMKAIRTALEPSDAQNHIRVVCFMTDGLVGNEFEIIQEVKNHPNARVFSFGIGGSVNHFLLDEMAREGRGEVEYVNLTDDGSAAARRFYERVRNPLLTDISIDWNGLPVAETFPREIPDLFDAKPVVISGRYTNGASGKIILRGKMQGQAFEHEIAVNFPETNPENDVLATLWARRKISDLMAQDLEGLQKGVFKDDLKQAITGLGLEFRLLTQFTSFVAVDEQTITENGVPKRVEVPVVNQTGREQFIENYWRRSGGGGGGGANYAMLSAGVNSTVTVDVSSTQLSTSVVSTETRDVMPQLQRGGSFQAPLSIGSGITQISESPVVEKRGLVSSSGQRPTSNNFSVDNLSLNLGVSTDETSLSRNAGVLPALTASGGTSNFSSLGQTQEITIKTMSAAKEQRIAGAEISLATRGGTNEFHGTVFETFGNEKLNANDFFANSRGFGRPDSRLNQFGATLGGFFLKDKAWFYGGYEGLRLQQAGFGISEVPTSILRQTAPGIYQPLLNAFPVATSGLETSNGFTEFAAVYTNPAEHDIFGLRIDAQPTSNLRIGGRYNFADSEASIHGDRDFSLNTLRKFDTQTNSFSAWTTYTATANVVIDGRVNFSRNRIGQRFSIDNFGGADTSAAIFSTPFDFLKFDFAGKNAAIAVGNPIATNVNQFQANGTIDWILNNHQFTFGTDFRRLSLETGAARTERSVLFTRVSPTLNTTTARVTELTRNVSENPELNNFSLFAQDSWKITSRLNVNLGLRWDADFAPKIEAQNIAFQNASLQMPDRLNNFAPRASVAYDIFGSGRAVLRGGAGLYFDYGNGAASDLFANSFPFAGGAFAQNTLFTAAPTNPLKPLQVFDDNLQTPRTWHVFAEYQQELFRNHVLSVNYTSSFGRKLFLARTFLNADPNYNYIRLTNNEAESDFNSLQIRFERRFSQGFSFNARYSLSKSKDNFSPDTLRETNYVSTDMEQERGSSDYDVRHQFSFYAVYDIPTFFGSSWAKQLTKDWSLSAFVNARSGFPITVGYSSVNDFGKEFFRADLVNGVPVFLNESEIKRLNPNAFTISQFNRQGSLKRNSLRGFPLFQLDTSLQRRIRFTNEMRLELAISAYNLLNNTNFADMSGNLGTLFPNGNFLENEYFGGATSVFGSANFTPFYLYGGARTVQFSAKFVF
jgi:Ca-activated chloride channel family protein